MKLADLARFIDPEGKYLLQTATRVFVDLTESWHAFSEVPRKGDWVRLPGRGEREVVAVIWGDHDNGGAGPLTPIISLGPDPEARRGAYR